MVRYTPEGCAKGILAKTLPDADSQIESVPAHDSFAGPPNAAASIIPQRPECLEPLATHAPLPREPAPPTRRMPMQPAPYLASTVARIAGVDLSSGRVALARARLGSASGTALWVYARPSALGSGGWKAVCSTNVRRKYTNQCCEKCS